MIPCWTPPDVPLGSNRAQTKNIEENKGNSYSFLFTNKLVFNKTETKTSDLGGTGTLIKEIPCGEVGGSGALLLGLEVDEWLDGV